LSICSLAGAEHKTALKRLEDEYLRKNLPDNLWDNLIRKDKVTQNKYDSVLVKHPWQYSTIINVEKIE
jgi:RNase adaptor protein for sRNA GlmZ degradation